MPGKKTRRQTSEGGLAITSLMDAMTIILCFLLKSYEATDVTIAASDELKIPASSALKTIKKTVALVVTKSQILVDDKPIVEIIEGQDSEGNPELRVDDADKKGQLITDLYDELLEKATEQKDIHAKTGLAEAEFKGRVLLQCDKRIPYSLVREVLYTAGQAQFAEFKFVVVKASG